MSSFQPLTDTIIADVDITPQRFDYPAGFFVTPPGVNSSTYLITNPNNFYVRVYSSKSPYTPVTSTTGILIPPNTFGVFGTTQPDHLSCMSVTKSGLTAGAGVIEIVYGMND